MDNNYNGLVTRLGIIGGGQLGQMLILAGIPLGLEFGVLSPSPKDPAARLASFHVAGSLHDADAIAALTNWADVTTYEIEHIGTDALRLATGKGAIVRPQPEVLDRVNDKLTQKQLLAAAGLPVPAIRPSPQPYPVVQKTRRGGYDGRGVAMLQTSSDPGLTGETFYESPVSIQLELAVIVSRSPDGAVSCYAPVEMVFDSALNLCSRVLAPARIDPETASRAEELAIAAVEVIGGVGVTAVELFLSTEGELLVNELAPRPHNSGHLTIESCATSQFEQHLRCIVGLPQGSTRLQHPAVMVNLLGATGADGTPQINGIADALALEGVNLHWYGKERVRPGRKMGHVTVTAESLESACQCADRVERVLRIVAVETDP